MTVNILTNFQLIVKPHAESLIPFRSGKSFIITYRIFLARILDVSATGD